MANKGYFDDSDFDFDEDDAVDVMGGMQQQSNSSDDDFDEDWNDWDNDSSGYENTLGYDEEVLGYDAVDEPVQPEPAPRQKQSRGASQQPRRNTGGTMQASHVQRGAPSAQTGARRSGAYNDSDPNYKAPRYRQPTTDVLPDPNKRMPSMRGNRNVQQDRYYDDAYGNGQQQRQSTNRIGQKGGAQPQVPVKKKPNILTFALFGVAVIILVFVIASKVMVKKEPEVKPQVAMGYEGSGHEALETLLTTLRDFDETKAKSVDDLVGREDGDSYLAQEWAYANNNQNREYWVKLIYNNLKFSYPEAEMIDTEGKPMKGQMGESLMNDGKGLVVEHIDYEKLQEQAELDRSSIENELKIKAYTVDDYDFQDECIDLMLEYLNGVEQLPVRTDTIDIDIEGGRVIDDSALDNLLFASDSLHNLYDCFDKIYTGFTGKKIEYYWDKEEVHNDEYDKWYKLFKKYYDADHGKFHKGVSKWEPWYKRNSKNRILKDKNGKKIVNYYSVKDKNGKDWIQPAKTKWIKVQKKREVDVTYEPETAVTYVFLGAYYAQHDYIGNQNPSIRVGDGTLEHPAGIGTPVITSVKCADGLYHDVKVTMVAWWLGKDAIDYCVTFSEKNRGIDPESVVQIVAYEIEVENLENKPITISSEMCLCDSNSNKSARTGTMYGFKTTDVTIQPHEKDIINDWASSTEIDQKYAIWGSSFDRQYNTVYFKILAGTGDVPTYSAYKSFTSKSASSGSSNVTPRDDDTLRGKTDTQPEASQEPADVGEGTDTTGMDGTGDGTDMGGTDSETGSETGEGGDATADGALSFSEED